MDLSRIQLKQNFCVWMARQEKLLQDLKECYTPMAERTGTLWEHDQPSASCCHGFASHVLYWLAKIYGTEKTQYAGA